MKKFWIGIDEVGRGALAGPVAVGAACLPKKKKLLNVIEKFGVLKDSKKLTKQKREEWAHFFNDTAKIASAVSYVAPSIIDKINIRQATNLAARRAFLKLKKKLKLENYKQCEIISDWGIFLGKDIPHKAMRNGDETFAAIKMASIIAKVSRDRLMKKLHLDFPQYGLAIHKGYGTRFHREAILKYGPILIHRRTFLKNLIK